jgi:hypothetical protein
MAKKKQEKTVYDHLEDHEKNAFWDKSGRLVFKEKTKEDFYPQFIIDAAFDLYLDGLTTEEISIKWDIDHNEVKEWYKSQSWRSKAKKINEKADVIVNQSKKIDTVSEKKELDKKHRGMIEWIQQEFLYTAKEDFQHEETKEQKRKQEWQLNRVKVLKLTGDAILALINKEREIAGVANITADTRDLPSDFTFTIKLPDEQNLNDTELQAILPSQDPHIFSTDADIRQLQIEAPKNENKVIPEHSEVDELDPVVMAQEYGEARPTVVNDANKSMKEIAKDIHPAFGFLQFGGGF